MVLVIEFDNQRPHTRVYLAHEVELVHALDVRGEHNLALDRARLNQTTSLITDLNQYPLIRDLGDLVIADYGRIFAKLMPEYPR